MINFNSLTKIYDVVSSIDLMSNDLRNYEKSLLIDIEKLIFEIELNNHEIDILKAISIQNFKKRKQSTY